MQLGSPSMVRSCGCTIIICSSLPGLLRRLRPDLRIGYFLHVSFPPQELFMQLPWRREIVEGILGADVVGFPGPVGGAELRRLGEPPYRRARPGAELPMDKEWSE